MMMPQIDGAGDGQGDGERPLGGVGGGAADDIDVGSRAGAWGSDADVLDVTDNFFAAGGWGMDDAETADWENLFGDDAQLHKVS